VREGEVSGASECGAGFALPDAFVVLPGHKPIAFLMLSTWATIRFMLLT